MFPPKNANKKVAQNAQYFQLFTGLERGMLYSFSGVS